MFVCSSLEAIYLLNRNEIQKLTAEHVGMHARERREREFFPAELPLLFSLSLAANQAPLPNQPPLFSLDRVSTL